MDVTVRPSGRSGVLRDKGVQLLTLALQLAMQGRWGGGLTGLTGLAAGALVVPRDLSLLPLA